MVAGGQGSRLGFDGPKGLYPLGPVTGRSLFALQAQRIRRLRARTGAAIPWYVMTSDATDAATRSAFAEAAYFGLPARDVFFLRQGMVPSFDFDGKLILERPDQIFVNPDGHGGSLTALLASGALDDMERRGITTIFYYQVDNPLVTLADPVLLGFHAAAGAEVSCKSLRKREPEEKMGVFARIDGRMGVVEYTEIAPEQRDARDAQRRARLRRREPRRARVRGRLRAPRRRRGRPLAALARLGEEDPDDRRRGRPARSRTQPNGFKLERFVFDALRAAETVCIVETVARRVRAREERDGRATRRSRRAASCRSATGAGSRRRACARRAPPTGSRSMNRGSAAPTTCARWVSRRSRTRPTTSIPASETTHDAREDEEQDREEEARADKKKPAPKKKPAAKKTPPKPIAKPDKKKAAKPDARAAKPDAKKAAAAKAAAPSARDLAHAAPPGGSRRRRRARRRRRRCARAARASPASAPTCRCRRPSSARAAAAGQLGEKYVCFSCGAKFYDLGKPEPRCPKCGADQREAPRQTRHARRARGPRSSRSGRSSGRGCSTRTRTRSWSTPTRTPSADDLDLGLGVVDEGEDFGTDEPEEEEEPEERAASAGLRERAVSRGFHLGRGRQRALRALPAARERGRARGQRERAPRRRAAQQRPDERAAEHVAGARGVDRVDARTRAARGSRRRSTRAHRARRA